MDVKRDERHAVLKITVSRPNLVHNTKSDSPET